MKLAFVLAAAACLAGCAQPARDPSMTDSLQLSLSEVNVQVDNAAGTVDVWLTLQNRHDMPLQNLSIHLVPRNEAGELIEEAHVEVQTARPLKAGEIVGPVHVTASTQGHQVDCIELYHVRAALSDHTITFVSGPDTLKLVESGASELCAPAHSEQVTI